MRSSSKPRQNDKIHQSCGEDSKTQDNQKTSVSAGKIPDHSFHRRDEVDGVGHRQDNPQEDGVYNQIKHGLLSVIGYLFLGKRALLATRYARHEVRPLRQTVNLFSPGDLPGEKEAIACGEGGDGVC